MSKADDIRKRIEALNAKLSTAETVDAIDANKGKLEAAIVAPKRIASLVESMGGKATIVLEMVEGKLTATVKARGGTGGTKSPSPLKAIEAIDVSVDGRKIGSTSVSRVMAACKGIDPKDAKERIYGKDSPVRVASSPAWIEELDKHKVTVHLPKGKSRKLSAILKA